MDYRFREIRDEYELKQIDIALHIVTNLILLFDRLACWQKRTKIH